MKPIIIFFILLFITPLVKAQEITTVENFLTDYRVTWQIDVEEPPSLGYAGDSYFGLFTRGEERNEYKHYDQSGQLLWSTESFDYSPERVAISESGNRVMIRRETHRDQDYRYFVTEVYDQVGSHLFSSPKLLYSFPSGTYFFSNWSGDDRTNLYVFDENGSTVPIGHRFADWDARPLDDSLLVRVNRFEITIVNIATNEVVTKQPMELIRGPSNTACRLECSRGKDKIALWNDHEIHILDQNLNLLNNFFREGYIYNVEFSPEPDIFSLIEFCPAYLCPEKPGIFGTIISLDGKLIGQIEIKLPSEEKFAGGESSDEDSRFELSFHREFFIYRFFSRPRYPPRDRYMGRSLVVRLNPGFRTMASEAVLGSRLYPMGTNEFLEISDENIRLWSMKEENDKKD